MLMGERSWGNVNDHKVLRVGGGRERRAHYDTKSSCLQRWARVPGILGTRARGNANCVQERWNAKE